VISIVVRVIDSFSIQMNLELVNKQKKKSLSALFLFYPADKIGAIEYWPIGQTISSPEKTLTPRRRTSPLSDPSKAFNQTFLAVLLSTV
tara:strand:- start:1538 stop:1804 length:267 start_codon:yes stop_codon:yes gene_type:complete